MTATAIAQGPTSRWTPMQNHRERERLMTSPALHRVVAAGRGSGKTEDAKRTILIGDEHHAGAMNPPYVGARYFVAGPTRDQVKDIWWADIKALCPREWLTKPPNETELRLEFVTGASIKLLGLDKPERAEGNRYAGGIVDECQKIKPAAWDETLYPTLFKVGYPPGWSLRIGRPYRRNHFFEWWTDAKTKRDHDSFHWPSSVVWTPEMVQNARETMDPRSFEQEVEASFLSLVGLVFYTWDPNKHLRPVVYNPALPLIFSFDFNVAPGSAVVLQEQSLPPWDNPQGEPSATTCVIDEVFIPSDSRTPEVCERLCAKFAGHKGDVFVYGDPAGNQRRTSAETNDWDQVMVELRKGFRSVRLRVPRAHPGVVDSVNSTNTRLCASNGQVRFALNPEKAKQTRKDFDSVQWDAEKSEREIDKSDLDRGHWADAVRYYIHERWPLGGSTSAIGV